MDRNARSSVKDEKCEKSWYSGKGCRLCQVVTIFRLAVARNWTYTRLERRPRGVAYDPLIVRAEPVSSYRCSVLVVDDEPAIRNLLSELLSSDFEVLGVPSAE